MIGQGRRYRGYFCTHDTFGRWAQHVATGEVVANERGSIVAYPGWGRLKQAIDASYRTPGIEYRDDEETS